MSNLWARVARYGDTPTEGSEDARRQRVHKFLERQPHGTMPLRRNWGPSVYNHEVHGIIAEHDGPEDLRHWEHLPDDVVSLKQPIHTHQGHVWPEMVQHKLHQDTEEDPYEDSGEYQEGGEDPKFVRHQGKHYLVDGHHRYAKGRLMGEHSMWGKVFDTANPEHKQANCYECHVNQTQDEGDWDHDSGSCEKCQHHGWYV